MTQNDIAETPPQQQALSETSSVSRANSPHFMTPTITSKLSQRNSPDNRATNPVSIKSIKSDKGQSLLQSAVQRVSLRKGPTHNTTRGKKRSPMKHSKVISFPDKLSTLSHTKILESPPTTPTTKNEERKASALDKPLPALPIVPLNTTGSMGSSTSLTESVDKRIPSPLFEEPSYDDRAGLELSQQPLCSDSLQHVTVKSGSQQRHNSENRQVMPRCSPIHEKKQESSSTKAQSAPNSTGVLHITGSLSDPFESEAATPKYHAVPENNQNLSAAAAALEKSTSETKLHQNPRQTRTSSLRARLSAGQLVKDSQNRVLGFTDFTVPRASSESLADPSRRETSGGRKEPPKCRTNDSLNLRLHEKGICSSLQKKTSVNSLHSNLSNESLVKGHVPAQVVGDSQHATPCLRPVSRDSNRNVSYESNSSSTSCRSQTSTPLLSRSLANSRADPIAATQTKPRKSSLPVPTHSALNAIFKPNSNIKTDQNSTQANITPKNLTQNEPLAPREQSSAKLVSDCEIEAKHSFKKGRSTKIFSDSLASKSRSAIKESPQQNFTLKRLSVKAPEYGPSLRISPAAERLIMGRNDDKENQPMLTKSPKRFSNKDTNGIRKKHYGGANARSVFKQHFDRPLSSHGMLQSSPRITKIELKAHERKAKSADMSSKPSTDIAATPDPSRQNTDASKGSQASSNDQSFFSAHEDYTPPVDEDDPEQISPQKDTLATVDEATWISGPREMMDETVPEPALTNSFAVGSHDVSTLTQEQPKDVSVNSPPNGSKVNSNDSATPSSSISNTTVKQQLFNPLQTIGKMSSHSVAHPPRSSSCVTHPDFINSPSCSEPEIAEKEPPTSPKDEDRQQNIQNSIETRHGHGSWRVDIADLESRRASSLHNTLVRENHESTSGPNTAKKPFSGLRNLFNKRIPVPDSSKSTTNQDARPNSSTKTKHFKSKSKNTSTTSNTSISSHYTPLLSVHSSYRPTLASSTRASPSPQITPTTIAGSPASTTANPTPATTADTPTPLASPSPTAISASTNLAMTLLHAARTERSSPKKEKLLQMSKIMVDAITQARDAEKAAEEAKMASRRADMAKEICGRIVEEVGRVVGEWSGNLTERRGHEA